MKASRRIALPTSVLVAFVLGACASGTGGSTAAPSSPDNEASPPTTTGAATTFERGPYGGLVPGEGAPEFVGTQEWFNTEPLTLQGLLERGQVVLVDFWTYSCFNCQNTQPYLLEWHEKYGDEGLTIVGVHTPEFRYEEDAASVHEAILAAGIQYPVVQDNDRATWRAFDNHVWPAMYLVGADGQIVYRHFGEGRYEETERAIREAIAAAGG